MGRPGRVGTRIAERGGRYYLYFTADAKIGVAVGSTPVGPFRDIGRPLVPENPGRAGTAIDPAVFTDRDGAPYLYRGNGSAFVAPLNPDMVSFDPATVRRISGLDGFGEGMFIRERAGTYHLTWSIPGTDEWYMAYHRFAVPGGDGTHREIAIDRIPITPDGLFGRVTPALTGPPPRPAT